jgi:hypothetical protein
VTTSEKRLLRIAILMFLGYVLPFEMAPRTYNYYKDYRQSLEKLQQNIQRYERLSKTTEYWENENKRLKQLHDRIEAGLLPGANRELMGINMQQLITQLANSSGIKFKKIDPPNTRFNTNEWILVIQTMKFEATSKTLMTFLKAVVNAKENLVIIELDVRSHQNRLNGNIQITGFGRILPPPPENEE